MAHHDHDLPFDADAPSAGRSAVAACLFDEGDDRTREAVILLASEMITHAVLSAEPPLSVECSKHGKDVYVFVNHAGPYTPMQGTARQVVDGLTDAFRIRPAPGRLAFHACL
jgi:hypothetical protein